MIISIYAALLGLLFLKLTMNTINTRRREKVAIGDGNNIALQRAIAAHNNFAQYVPISLLLIAFVEMQSAPSVWIHVLGIALLVSRALHAYGISQINENFKYRTYAMITTISVISAACFTLIWQSLAHYL